jgi:hypothetical protein
VRVEAADGRTVTSPGARGVLLREQTRTPTDARDFAAFAFDGGFGGAE